MIQTRNNREKIWTFGGSTALTSEQRKVIGCLTSETLQGHCSMNNQIYTKVILKLIRTGSRWREARAGDLRLKQTAGTVTTHFRK